MDGCCAEPDLQQGFALNDFDKFADTPAGIECLAMRSLVLSVSPKALLILPPSCLCCVTLVTANTNKLKTKRDVVQFLNVPV